ncbi:hypothetical protein AK812_SmicGene1323 [Symbiodinium microadriaticum]|uniref:Uncharacterized protein n=1 Tax=Symbiodinium microadriaticum TaxID=2951 RepID=A0A1Q9F4I0_SYMMI|nr:hypothetical protein AK812_SmicGene1323 [Symbiodinium microadriaticum]
MAALRTKEDRRAWAQSNVMANTKNALILKKHRHRNRQEDVFALIVSLATVDLWGYEDVLPETPGPLPLVPREIRMG